MIVKSQGREDPGSVGVVSQWGGGGEFFRESAEKTPPLGYMVTQPNTLKQTHTDLTPLANANTLFKPPHFKTNGLVI
jgi:hypothetical protein